MPAIPGREAAAALDEAANRARPSLHLMSPARARDCYERESLRTGRAPLPVSVVRDMAVNSRVQARLYRPTEGTLPVVLFFHGGGWVVGSINTHDHMCRELALRSGCAVLNVGYRLAPEHPFPAAVDDAEAALSWVRGHGAEHDLDVDRLAVAGDSAGGNVAAALTIRARMMGVPLRLQLLFYPVTTTDLSVGIDPQYEGLVLSRDELVSHQDHYLPNATDRHRAESSPLDCADLRGLPEAVVVVAECDPIAPQGLRYAEALRVADVPVTVHLHPGSTHGFAQFPGAFETGRTALRQAADALQRAFLDERA